MGKLVGWGKTGVGGTRAAWAEADVLAREVVPGAFATVVVAADLLRTGR